MKIVLAEIDFPMIPTRPLNYGSGITVYHIAHARLVATDSSGVESYFPAERVVLSEVIFSAERSISGLSGGVVH